jgi:acetyltransferase-like isoleucine patch superfamily enzyme
MRGHPLFKLKKKILKLFAKGVPGASLRIWLLRKCNYLVGTDTYIGEDIIIVDDLDERAGLLTIGNRVAVSPRVTFVVHSSPNESRIAPYVNPKTAPIVVEDDAWIGTGAVILPGTTIGEGAVVAANAVVIASVSPYTIVGGVPARVLKTVHVPWISHDLDSGIPGRKQTPRAKSGGRQK